jgi:hypothetical protein
MTTESFRNTEKEVFTVAYPLSVPVNALDHGGHQIGARSGNRPRAISKGENKV